jgi:hypothetical protein
MPVASIEVAANAVCFCLSMLRCLTCYLHTSSHFQTEQSLRNKPVATGQQSGLFVQVLQQQMPRLGDSMVVASLWSFAVAGVLPSSLFSQGLLKLSSLSPDKARPLLLLQLFQAVTLLQVRCISAGVVARLLCALLDRSQSRLRRMPLVASFVAFKCAWDHGDDARLKSPAACSAVPTKAALTCNQLCYVLSSGLCAIPACIGTASSCWCVAEVTHCRSCNYAVA